MSQNPFDALGGGEGGLDMNALLQQAQQMQEQLQATQKQLEETTIDGTSGGAVTVTVTGTGELTAVTVEPGHFDGGDAESLADLGDMVVAAFRDARAKADAMVQEQMGPLAGGGMPGLPGDSGPGSGGGGPLGFQ